MTLEHLHQLFLEHPNACTDTRNITENCIFFALKGENFNGNSFAQDALKKGAAYAVIDDKEYADSEYLLLVDNVLETLQNLGNYHRNYCDAKVIALTGSNGKTTTKELILSALKTSYKTIATKGNLNNHIGVPLTLLNIRPNTEMAIVEMGANHLDEIRFLCDLAQPDFGYITNFGKAHLEGFGSEAGVIQGKSELYDYLIANNKYVFLNADDPIQLEKLGTYIKKFGYSTTNHQYFQIQFSGAHPFVKLQVDDIEIHTQLIGSYNFTNCCAAVLIGKYFNVPILDIKKALENYVPTNNRSQLIEKNGFHIILDAYNANPSSMTAALDNFNELNRSPKTVILGDMFELGFTAHLEHQQIADYLKQLKIDHVHLVGENFLKVNTSFKKFNSYESLKLHLEKHPLQKGAFLIKGSRGMALERILDIL